MANYIDRISYGHEDGYDVRCVDLHTLHNITTHHMHILLTNIKPNGKILDILDVGCGDGETAEAILSYFNQNAIRVYALDICRRACINVYQRLNHYPNLYVYHDDVKSVDLNQKFDYIIVKNLLHEIPFNDQKQVLYRLFKLLKQNGRILIWDFFLYENTADFVRNVVKFKDKLCGYSRLVNDREFITYKDFETFLLQKKLHLKDIYSYDYKFSTLRQLKFEGALTDNNLQIFNNHVRLLSNVLTPHQKEQIQLSDNLNSDISFIINCKIILIENIDDCISKKI